ncbi:MAG: VanZ family protein [Saprospiraceae bacterium]|nr:VanZ family protein [Saprospiraceae bacterium]MBK7795752.1 VanZ family protein [Saprospiraceae bacterium]MBK8154299.1 VanZ family protein [Saprospiraceae bacterium]MBL0260863.1 VanZ family protein [Saprospiraceae bacterium]MBX7163555.1 VanZ family protein [Saprospiraceae bacterium]
MHLHQIFRGHNRIVDKNCHKFKFAILAVSLCFAISFTFLKASNISRFSGFIKYCISSMDESIQKILNFFYFTTVKISVRYALLFVSDEVLLAH